MTAKQKRFILLLATVLVFVYGIHAFIPNRLVVLEGEGFASSLPPGITSCSDGKYQLKIFGIMPFKTVHIDIIKNTKLIPSGKTVGIRLNYDGVMVVSLSSFKGMDGKSHSPAGGSGIKKGDIIRQINGGSISTISQLMDAVKACGANPMDVLIDREGSLFTFSVAPVLSKDDNANRIGIWVRESSAGIGTITYIDPESKSFGALGHGITDIDTGKIIPAKSGDVLCSNVDNVKKGSRGLPGELRGSFSSHSVMGTIEKNTENGIFGTLGSTPQDLPEPLSLAPRAQIERGEAYILANVEGEAVKKYSVLIENINKSSMDNKGMIISITDPELIRKTGGIVQGMSGCPIIQNNKIVGAITHVFINNPIKGYATFLDVMLNNAIK